MATTAKKFMDVLRGWLGRNEADGSHKVIIDTYNSKTPRARGYRVKYTDKWCATTLSAAAIAVGATDICPIECGCAQLIELAKALGIWVENENRVPSIGDWVLYDWDDKANNFKVTDNQGHPEHVGAVDSVDLTTNTFVVIEGNKNNAVERRTLEINGRYIRGFIVPKYEAEPAVAPAPAPAPSKPSKQTLTFKKNDIVNFTGTKHYSSATAKKASACKGGAAKVTATAPGKAHPYHLVRVLGKGATVYGWVDEQFVKEAANVTQYYDKYTGNSTKIDEIFKSIGVPSVYIKDRANKTWAVRKPVAAANGITGYQATAAQNIKLINLAKEGKLVKA